MRGDDQTITAADLKSQFLYGPAVDQVLSQHNAVDPNLEQRIGNSPTTRGVRSDVGTWGAIPNMPIQKQLEGTGQLRDLRRNPNLKGVDVDALLKKTPVELEEMVKKGLLSQRMLKVIKKTFEGRGLGGRGK